MKKTVSRFLIVAALALAAAASLAPARADVGGRCYVKVGALGANTGESWADAYTQLYSATGNGLCMEIWVAQGVYTPDPSNRANTFYLRANMAIYGGFAGNETTLDQRWWQSHVTVLSGDIDNNDTNADDNHIAETYADIQNSNSYHVVTAYGGAPTPVLVTTVLDGFTITAGDGSAYGGGGMMCQGNESGSECSPTLRNLVFSGNKAIGNNGGALLNLGLRGVSSPWLTNVTFTGNRAQDGGAMYNFGEYGESSPHLIDVTFSNNSATRDGGAMYNFGYDGASSPELKRVTFSGNSAGGSGGAIINEAATGVSNPRLGNVTFYGNTAPANWGGAMYSDSSTGTSHPLLYNVTFNGNSAAYGGAMYSRSTSGGTTALSVYNVILWGNTVGAGGLGPQMYNDSATADIRYSVVQGGCASIAGADCSGGGIVDTNPLLGPLQDNGCCTDTMALLAGSSAVDTGVNSVCVSSPVSGVDQRGMTRPLDGTGLGPPTCDIGAYEYAANPLQVVIGGSLMGNYGMPSSRDYRVEYSAVNDGPVTINGLSSAHILASERFIYAAGSGSDHRSGASTSYSEIMGFPGTDLASEYWFPWYNNVNMWSQLRLGNPHDLSTTVSVYLGTTLLGSYPLGPNQSTRVDYPGVNGGPLRIVSSDGASIIGAERVIYSDGNGTAQNGNHTSYFELMGFPADWVTNEYYIPWYNNVNMWSQLRLANLSPTLASTVNVYLGAGLLGSYPMGPSSSLRVDFPGVNGGPLRVAGTGGVPILVAERVIYSVGGVQNGTHTSYSELMAIPEEHLTTTYWFPSYSYPDTGTWSQLRFGNPSSTSSTTVNVYLAGTLRGTYGLGPSESKRVDFLGQDSGPLEVTTTDGSLLMAAVRVIQAVGGTQTSYSEVLGYPDNQLTTVYVFPWYNNFNFDSQIRMAVP